MAVVKLFNGDQLTMSHERALTIWQVLNGELDGTDEQKEFCSKVEKVYLNRYKAPDSYLHHYAEIFRKMDK